MANDATPTAVAEVAQAVAAVANEQAKELAAPIVAAAIEHAEQRVAAANEAAEQLVDAFAATETGRRIVELERGLGECRSQIAATESNLSGTLAQVQASLTELTTRIASPAPVVISPSIPQNSQEPEAEAVTIMPAEALEDVAGAAQEVAERTVKKVRRWT